MKRLILTLVAALISVGAMADEGMWLLPYLQKMNIKDMKAKGHWKRAYCFWTICGFSSRQGF